MKIFIVLVLVLQSTCVMVEPMRCGITVYYLPLNIEFYTPPDEEYLKTYGQLISNI